MSKENLEQFIRQISDSEELQTRIGEEIDAESLIALGGEHGYEFSVEEIENVSELDDSELDQVTGGAAFIKFDGVAGKSAMRQRSFRLKNSLSFIKFDV